MYGGEDERFLQKIVGYMQKAGVVLLLLHFYVYCYAAWKDVGFAHDMVRRFLLMVARTGLFSNLYVTKLAALGLLILSLIGAKGKKDEKIKAGEIIAYITCGFLLYFIAILVFYVQLPALYIAAGYCIITATGYLMIMAGGNRLSRLIKLKLAKDIFNTLNESFPQEERRIENQFSVNLPARYNLKGKLRKSWVNVLN